jgi:hydroxymethylbilane synthase
MKNPLHIRIGTRTSLMAMAQTKKVARLLQQKYPHVTCELIGIIPSGDKDKKTPLWQMNIVGIFSKELDDKLLQGEVDCTVHSFKDLGTQRPAGLKIAALLPRDNMRDVVLFRHDILDRIKQDQEIVIGTSSPRRMTLLPEFLSQALPQLGTKQPRIRTETMRGNANTRIEKLKSNNDDSHFDGIALALSGLGRLFEDDEAHHITKDLLYGLKWMVMPLTVCPTAPGQGVVCVEVNEKNDELFDLFQSLNDVDTAQAVQAERNILLQNGGGCHQKFGVTKLQLPNMVDEIILIRGQTKDDVVIDEERWLKPDYHGEKILWDGQAWREKMFKTVPLSVPQYTSEAAFISHVRACPENFDPSTRLWVSGTTSWFKLAKQGLWVEGCADGFGFDFIRSTLQEPVLSLPPLAEWAIYTHEQASKQWSVGHVIATYRLEIQQNPAMIQALRQADIAWWASESQYTIMADHCGHLKRHACGAGKTAEFLKAKGVSPLVVFPNRDACKRWLDDNRNTTQDDTQDQACNGTK